MTTTQQPAPDGDGRVLMITDDPFCDLAYAAAVYRVGEGEHRG